MRLLPSKRQATTPPPESALIADLRSVVGAAHVLHQLEDLIVFEYDAYLETGRPDVVVQPADGQQVAAVVRVALRHRLPVIPRGAATGLSGGAIAIRGGIVVDLNRMARLLSVRPDDGLALVEPGLVNSELSKSVAHLDLEYAPDPSSQRTSTIGGNIAENAGGPHCLAQGMTTNHVVGLELVAGDGHTYQLGGPAPDPVGYDLTGLVVGSEGTLGVVTKAWVRLIPPATSTLTYLALFATLEQAGEAVSAIIAAGVVPSALELIDGPTVRALEQAFQAGYPESVEGVLLIDLAGRPEDVESEGSSVATVCRSLGALELRRAETTEQRTALWAARKGALAALARIAPNYYLHDMVVPRSRLAEVLRKVLATAAEHDVLVTNVAHAGDGNLHPTLVFDLREPGMLPKIVAAGEAILRVGVEAGGTISGEHGIGLEKQEYMAWIFTPDDLGVMQRVREVFNPGELFNPGKLFPQHPPRTPRVKVWATASVTPDTWI